MDETLNNIVPVLLLAFFLWNLGLSVMVWWIFNNIKRMSTGLKQGNLLKVLDEVKKAEDNNKSEIEKVLGEISEIKKRDLSHLQKVGLTRFNPFNETGGDQSFSLCLLDDKDNGFIISCLHTRDRTRVYAKPVSAGESKVKLSEEEKKALREAKK